MDIKITFLKTKKMPETADAAVLFVFKGNKPSKAIEAFDKKSKDFIVHALKSHKKFEGKSSQACVITMPKGSSFSQVIAYGLGDPSKITPITSEDMGGRLFLVLEQQGIEKALILGALEKGLKEKECNAEQMLAHVLNGIHLRSYKYYQYKESIKKKIVLKKCDVFAPGLAKAASLYTQLSHVNAGVFLTRDLVNAPPNAIFPVSYAKLIKKELEPLGVVVDVLDEKKMKAMGMGAILAVGQGSENPPRMVVMRWVGDKSGKPSKAAKPKANAKAQKKQKSSDAFPIAFVGKGVTFDTGGVSLKPPGAMQDMKMDMGGSAVVVGLMKALALRKAKVNVIGAVGLAENMPSSKAYRPDDIITSYAGKTIEVHNTDAEGRLVLADTLTHIQNEYAPKTIIDLATLTGAMMVALGHEYCGSFVNSDRLWSGLEKASAQTGEKLWRMPLDEVWRNEMVSPVADLQNLAKNGRFAGACTAAGFLEHFIEKGTDWAHLDIAGTAWRKMDKPTVPKYGTGFGVRVLNKFVANIYG